MYLNSLPFGSNVEGIGSAARSFFGKTPDQLSDAQIHALAVIPRRPALYNPAVNADAAYSAALEIGKTTGFAVSQQEWLMAMNGAGTYAYPLLLPHITRYAAVRGGGAAQKGARPRSEIHLSVDGQLSLDAEQLITTRLEQNRDARITNGAAFLIDNSTGEILVWAGSGDLSAEGSEINGVLVKNQPGSAMKPFLYALALEMGFAPSMPLPDVPLDFGAEEIYVPLNFNNHYNGPVLFRNALASSLNVPAVYVLERVGIDNYLAKLSQLGFDSLAGTRERTGLSLALGSGEVTLYEMVRAFSVFARDGTLPQLSVESLGANNGALRGLRSAPQRGGADKQADKRTRSLAARGETSPRLFKKDTARIICSILSDKRARASGFAFSSVLAPPYPAIFKTGTANQFQDIIALGATTRYTAGVWMGNFSGATVVGRTGSSIPAEVVRALLDALVARDESAGVFAEPFALPETFALADVCALSGLAPSPACPSVTREFAPLGLEDALQMCAWHTNEGGRVAVRYPAEYQRWFMAKNTGASLFDAGGAPQFLYPADGAVFVYENAQSKTVQRLSVDCAGGNADTARLFVNGVYAGESGRPFFWSIPLALGEMRLRVECAGENAEISVMVR